MVGSRVAEAFDLFERLRISELPVLDAAGRPIGLVDITDLIGLGGVDPEELLPEGNLRRTA